MNISALQKAMGYPTLVEEVCGRYVLFFSPQMYGKWYDVAIGTTCKWMKNYKEKFNMGTLLLGPGPSADQISTISTRLRYEQCCGCSGMSGILCHGQSGCSRHSFHNINRKRDDLKLFILLLLHPGKVTALTSQESTRRPAPLANTPTIILVSWAHCWPAGP